jgi:hypothetical protein
MPLENTSLYGMSLEDTALDGKIYQWVIKSSDGMPLDGYGSTDLWLETSTEITKVNK